MQKTKKLFPIGIIAIGLAWTLAMMPAPSSAATLNVPTEKYPTIQAAINVAVSGDTVEVAAGTYYETIIMKSGVSLQGAGAHETTIAGTGFYVIFCGVSDCKIDGFTIKGSQYGIWNWPSSPTITNNIITGNTYYGIYNDTRYSVSSLPTITDNTITGNNYCGIYNKAGSSPTITNNIITGNGWGMYNYGGIHNDNEAGSSPTITNNIITGNNPYGIYNYISSPTITNNIITNNGKGIQNWGASPEITNNTITGNIDSGIYNEVGSSPTITNNIITGGDCGIYNYFYSSPAITYNDLFVPDGTDICNDETSSPTVRWNRYEDPMFENPDEADYHLQAGSPCIDAGTNDAPGLPETDFDGNDRIINNTVDIGAFECLVSNSPPVADAGSDQTVEATGPTGASVTLDGSGSYDPDGNPLSYVWTWGEDGYAEGVNPTITLPLASTAITLTVSDGDLTNDDEVMIVIQDTIPPDIRITYPSHDAAVFMDEQIDVQYYISDICDLNPTVTVDPSDPILPPLSLGELTIVVTAIDKTGNEASAEVTVTVLGPLGIKEGVLRELESVDTAGCWRVDRVIDKVITFIDKSLKDRYWVDDLHLDARHGSKVFTYESLAVGDMKLHIKLWGKRGPTPAQQQAIDAFEAVIPKLVKADKLLAETAIDEAKNATDPWSPGKSRAYNRFLTKADKDFEKALSYMDKDRPGLAIVAFERAWKFAQQAMRLAQ